VPYTLDRRVENVGLEEVSITESKFVIIYLHFLVKDLKFLCLIFG